MKFPDRWLATVAVAFIAYGLGFMIFPAQLAEVTTGAEPIGPSAVTDMRAAHGGAPFGVGLFMAVCARRRDWVRPGLSAAMLTSSALALSRLAGLLVDGSPTVPMVVALLFEIVLTGASILALSRLSPSNTQGHRSSR